MFIRFVQTVLTRDLKLKEKKTTNKQTIVSHIAVICYCGRSWIEFRNDEPTVKTNININSMESVQERKKKHRTH